GGDVLSKPEKPGGESVKDRGAAAPPPREVLADGYPGAQPGRGVARHCPHATRRAERRTVPNTAGRKSGTRCFTKTIRPGRRRVQTPSSRPRPSRGRKPAGRSR